MFDRLVRLMSFLSQSMTLPGRIRVMNRGEAGDILVFLSPDQGKEAGLSAVNDAAASAVRLADGWLFIGEGNAFIQYRDGRAPRGYDAPEFKSTPGRDELMLVDRRGPAPFGWTNSRRLPWPNSASGSPWITWRGCSAPSC